MQFFNGVKLSIVNYYGRFPTLSALERQVSGYLPASSSRKNRTNSDFFLLPHLARFLVRPLGCSRFHFVESYIVGLAMSEVVLMKGDVAVGLSRFP